MTTPIGWLMISSQASGRSAFSPLARPARNLLFVFVPPVLNGWRCFLWPRHIPFHVPATGDGMSLILQRVLHRIVSFSKKMASSIGPSSHMQLLIWSLFSLSLPSSLSSWRAARSPRLISFGIMLSPFSLSSDHRRVLSARAGTNHLDFLKSFALL